MAKRIQYCKVKKYNFFKNKIKRFKKNKIMLNNSDNSDHTTVLVLIGMPFSRTFTLRFYSISIIFRKFPSNSIFLWIKKIWNKD